MLRHKSDMQSWVSCCIQCFIGVNCLM